MSQTTETALALPEQGKQLATRTSAYAPQNVTEAMALAKLIAQSDLAPKDFKGKPANVMIAMQMGAELGLSPMASIQNIAVINGRPSLWGDAALGVVQVHPAYESHKEWLEGDGEKRVGIFQIKRKGQDVHESRFSFTDAKKAGLWGKAGPWTQYPDRMLCLRARGFGLRDKFADALRGLILVEEAMDMPPDAPRRERAALDADALASLSPSEEPNRGHGNEGMQRTETPTEPVTEKPKASRTHRGVVTVTKIEPRMKNPTPAQVAKAKTEKKEPPQSRPYFVLTCSEAEGNENAVASWDTKHHEYIVRAINKECELSIAANDKGDRVFYNLEHIHRIGEQQFENDIPVVPAEQGEYQPPTGADLFESK